jgi:hypothetical protein
MRRSNVGARALTSFLRPAPHADSLAVDFSGSGRWRHRIPSNWRRASSISENQRPALQPNPYDY